MKRLVLGGLTTLLVSAVATPAAVAEMQTGAVSSPMSYDDVRMTEAFNLVSFAYRGQLEDEGISSYGQLVNDFRTGDISAEDVVRAGIEDGYLTENALEDEDYLNAVRTQLNAFTIGN
ncbi:MAG: hypothetical protein ACFE0J_22790 [Elainellaceae cyanobacterium]